jgi:hypothetical protein
VESNSTAGRENDSEDTNLSLFVSPVSSRNIQDSCLTIRSVSSRISTLEFAYGILPHSVEATISMKLRGSWPAGVQVELSASTSCLPEKSVILLPFQSDQLWLQKDGTINLARRVVSVQDNGFLTLKACTISPRDREQIRVQFKPAQSGKSDSVFDLGFCSVNVVVAWSLVLR